MYIQGEACICHLDTSLTLYIHHPFIKTQQYTYPYQASVSKHSRAKRTKGASSPGVQAPSIAQSGVILNQTCPCWEIGILTTNITSMHTGERIWQGIVGRTEVRVDDVGGILVCSRPQGHLR